jgi:hypothetical protein
MSWIARGALGQGGRAHPGLAGHEDDPAGARPRVSERLVQRSDGGIALEQLHRPGPRAIVGGRYASRGL